MNPREPLLYNGEGANMEDSRKIDGLIVISNSSDSGKEKDESCQEELEGLNVSEGDMYNSGPLDRICRDSIGGMYM